MAMAYRSPVHGAFRTILEQHVVQGRVIVPGAGYLEMAHVAGTAEASSTAARLSGVFFLVPLALSEEADGAVVSIEFTASVEFEISSTGMNGSSVTEVHCSGAYGHASQEMPHIFTFEGMNSKCTEQVDTELGYHAFDFGGLNLGPAFRLLEHVWKSPAGAASLSLLRPRVARQGTQVHPADLDSALQTSHPSMLHGDRTLRLPFAVDSAVLKECHGSLWAGTEIQAGGTSIVQLAPRTRNDQMTSRVDGFNTRELRAVAKRQPWYVTDWHSSKLSELSSSRGTETLLLLSDEGAVPGHDVLATNTSPASIADVVSKSLATIVASPLQRETMERQGVTGF